MFYQVRVNQVSHKKEYNHSPSDESPPKTLAFDHKYSQHKANEQERIEYDDNVIYGRKKKTDEDQPKEIPSKPKPKGELVYEDQPKKFTVGGANLHSPTNRIKKSGIQRPHKSKD